MTDEKKKGIQLVDLAGIGNLLEHLVSAGCISCEERDRIICRIAQDGNFSEVSLSVLAGYRRSKKDVSERTTHRKLSEVLPTCSASNEEYVSLTELVRAHSEGTPGYVIQSWLRNENTLAFLNLWEKENNPTYCEHAYLELLEKKKAASFTLTPKQWIDQTKAIGIVLKQGKPGGTFAHPMIACEFASWLTPEFKMLLLKLSLIKARLG